MKQTQNRLRLWFDQDPPPMYQKEFALRIGISQSFLTSLLDERPPWPKRETLRRINKETDGYVTADHWMELDDPPVRDS